MTDLDRRAADDPSSPLVLVARWSTALALFAGGVVGGLLLSAAVAAIG